jgi:hypothetical protein
LGYPDPPHLELISGRAALLIPLAVVAVLVVLFTRGRLAYEPERAAGGAAAQQRVR